MLTNIQCTLFIQSFIFFLSFSFLFACLLSLLLCFLRVMYNPVELPFPQLYRRRCIFLWRIQSGLWTLEMRVDWPSEPSLCLINLTELQSNQWPLDLQNFCCEIALVDRDFVMSVATSLVTFLIFVIIICHVKLESYRACWQTRWRGRDLFLLYYFL